MTNTKENLTVVLGDITTLSVDAIVTPADPTFRVGQGIDAAVRRAAGAGLTQECEALGVCPRGQARLTQGHRLPCRFVIHAVGPVYVDGLSGESEVLHSAIVESLKLAAKFGVHSVAIPPFGSVFRGFPKEEAAIVTLAAVREWMSKNERPSSVIFCCLSEDSAQVFRSILGSTDDY